jgi:hypothetical protein
VEKSGCNVVLTDRISLHHFKLKRAPDNRLFSRKLSRSVLGFSDTKHLQDVFCVLSRPGKSWDLQDNFKPRLLKYATPYQYSIVDCAN